MRDDDLDFDQEVVITTTGDKGKVGVVTNIKRSSFGRVWGDVVLDLGVDGPEVVLTKRASDLEIVEPG